MLKHLHINPSSDLGKTLISLRQHVYQLSGFSLVLNLLYLLPSIYMLQVYDRVLSSRSIPTLIMLTLFIIGGYILLAAIEWVRSSMLVRINNKIDRDLSNRVFDASFQSALYKSATSPSQAMQDMFTMRSFFGSGAMTTILDIPWVPIYLGIAFLFNFWMGVLLIIGATILFALAWWNEQVSRQPLADANNTSMKANYYINTAFMNAEVIEAMGMQNTVQNRWQKFQELSLIQQTLASDRSASVASFTKFFRILLQSLMLGLGALLVLDNQISSGMMIAGSIIMGRALAPVEGIIGVWKQLANARMAMQRLEQLLDTHAFNAPGMPLPKPEGHLSVENITVVPPNAKQATLQNLTFSLNAGEVVCVIGPSASGKSTLARAIMGVWPLEKGTIRLDQADIHQWNKSQLGPWLGYLPQDVELFQGSIAENISRLSETPDTEKVLAAAKLAGVHEMILHLPDGYDSVLGAGGLSLSGGQRQRIGLARALYDSPSLIVLDEPNANLDEAGDLALFNAIKQLKQERKTVVIITHKASILQVADKLIVLQEGQLQLFGPKDAVINRLNELRQATMNLATTNPTANNAKGAA